RHRDPGTRRRNRQRGTRPAGLQRRQERGRVSHSGRHRPRPSQRRRARRHVVTRAEFRPPSCAAGKNDIEGRLVISHCARDDLGRVELPPGRTTYYNGAGTRFPSCDWKEQAMFIQTEPTPNPATLKFLPGRTVLASGTLDMRDKESAAKSPLAERLL